MERLAQIVGDIVVNVANFDPEHIPEAFVDWVPCGGANVGWSYDGQAFTPPAPKPVTDADRVLSRPQFAFLLARTGFDDVWDALQVGAKGQGDLTTYATLKAERDRSSFRLDRTLTIVTQFRTTAAQIAPDVDLSDAAIRAAWDQAEEFQGAAV